MNWLSRLSLTQKLLVALIIPLLVACMALGLIISTQLNAQVPALMKSAGDRQLEARASEIGQWIGGYHKWLNGLVRDERLPDMTSLADRQRWLANRHTGEAGLESIFLADREGNVVTNDGDTVNVRQRDYFRTLVTDGTADQVLTEPMMSKVSGEPIAIFAQALFDEDGQRVGVLGAPLTMKSVTDITSRISMGDGSYGYLLDGDGTIVAHPNPELVMNVKVTDMGRYGFENGDIVGRSMLDEPSGNGSIVTPDGQSSTVFWTAVPGTGWTLAMMVPDRIFTAVSRELLGSLLLAGIVILVVLLAILGFTAHRALSPIRQTALAMADIAEGKGDLTRRLDVRSRDEVGELAVQFNAFVERMQNTLRQVRGNARQVLGGANEMAEGTHELSSRTEQAAANLQETSASMEQIHSTVAHTSQAAEQANGLTRNAAETTERGSRAMSEVEAKMAAITDSAAKIGEIIGLIDSIAFQTNILALNASVEAARAGEQGRGFAVVAGEVRHLASRSAEAARDIRELIDTSARHTQEGNHLVKDAAEQMQAIHRGITQVADVIGEITAGTREQTTGIEQVNTAVAEMDTVTQRNAGMVSQNAGLAETMRDNAQRLDALMAEFILGDDAADASLAAPHHEPLPASRPATTLPASRSPARREEPEPEWEAF
ncbi:methyl-accepting chemotaxis protein [Halomonas sp. THAF12]|uniref:methyl-accepting chemotaxis protein n=1 Tax=Halomonas sp. B23F22_10 TaxID=3459515 RepID=UPI00373E1FFC